MRCSQMFVGLMLASLLAQWYAALEVWMLSLVDRSDATSMIGFAAWSAFFFYLTVRIICSTVALRLTNRGR